MQRIRSLDILKLFAMFLVVWGHCVQFLLTSDCLDEPAFVYIHSFHLPLFFMISGLFVRQAKWSSLLVRARQLLLPCLSWGLLMSLGNLVQPLLVGTTAANSLWDTLFNNFWFLKSLFVCFALWYGCIALFRLRWLAIVISLLLSQCITLWSVQWSYPTFVIGIMLAPYLDDIRLRKTPVALVSLLIGGLLLIGWNRSFLSIPAVYTWPLAPNGVILANIGMRVYKIVLSTALSLGFIALFLHLDSLLPQRSTLNRLAGWGQLTLGIYIIHSLIIIVRERLCPTLFCCDSLNPWLFNTVIAPLAAAMLLLVSVGITRLIMLAPRLSFFFLGTPWPKRQVT